MPAYLSVSELKLRLGITASTYDTSLADMLDGVEVQIEQYLGYAPASVAGTEYYSGLGTQFIQLIRKPVTLVSAVYLGNVGLWGQGDDPFPADSLLVAGEDYAVQIEANTKQGTLVYLNGNWPNQWSIKQTRLAPTLIPGFGNIKATYTAGLNSTQMNAIEQAGYAEAAALYNSWKFGAGIQTSSSLDGRSVSFSILDQMRSKTGSPRFVSPVAEVMLRPYRVPAFGRV